MFHETPVHHDTPVAHYPHHAEYHQEEPHVELDHHEKSGPVGHEYTTVIPHHGHEYAATHGVHHDAEYKHYYPEDHYYDHHSYKHHKDKHYYREAPHHYYD